MRILKVDLRAFSHFSNCSLNFDPKKNLHVLFGENEAGKTSFARAIQAILFGIERKTTDDFIHPKENLYVEGLLQNKAGKFIQLSRAFTSKRKQEQQILSFFPSLDKQTILNLFFLNQESIVMGSKDLIENIRHFDLSLFASIRGTQGILKTLKEIDSEIELLYKPRGVKPAINQKLYEIEANRLEEKKLLLSLECWQDLQEEMKESNRKKERLSKSCNNTSLELSQLAILQEIHAYVEKLQNFGKQVEHINKEEVLDEAFIASHEKIALQYKEQAKQRSHLEQQLEDTNEGLKHLKYDQELLSKKPHLQILSKDYSDYIKAVASQIQIENELKEAKPEFKKVNLVLQNLIKSSFSLNNWNRVRGNILDILESLKIRCAINDKNQKLKAEYSAQIQKLIEEKKSLKAFKLENGKELLWKIQAHLDLGLTSHIDKKLLEYNAVGCLSNNLSRESIRSLTKPNEKILAKFSNSYFDLVNKYSANHEKLLKLRDELSTLKINQPSTADEDIDLDLYFKNKSTRQELSKALLSKWTSKNLAEKYSQYIELKTLLDEEDSVETFLFSNINQLIAIDKHSELVKEIQISIVAERKFLEEISTLELLYNNQVDPNKLFHITSFLEVHLIKEILTFFESIGILQEELKKEVAFSNLQNEICNFLETKSSIREISTLTAALEKDLQEKEQSNALVIKIEQQILSFEKSNETLHAQIIEEDELLQELEKKWKRVCLQFQIESAFSIDEIENLIKHMDHFFHLSKNVQSKNENLKECLTKIESYINQVQKVFGFTKIKPEMITKLNSEIETHEAIKSEYEKLSYLKKTRGLELKSVENELGQLAKESDGLFNKCSIEKSGFTENQLLSSKNYYLLKSQIQELTSILEFKCGSKNLDKFLNQIKQYKSLDEIRSKYQDVSEEHKVLQSDLAEVQNELGALQYRDSLVYNFDKKHQLEVNLQSQVFKLNEQIQRFLLAKTSAQFIRETIWDYQNKHQKKILGLASSYFNELTDGRYVDLQLNFLEDKESLLECMNSKNKKIAVNALSEGTRDQLYISLKFAFAEIYFENNEPFPFILDDILVNFDDRRAQKCIKIIERISLKTQVIFLTHHKHLVDLLERTIPSITADYLNLSRTSPVSSKMF